MTTTGKKRANRAATITVRLPRGTCSKLKEISALAGVTIDQLVSVIIATKIVQMREQETAP